MQTGIGFQTLLDNTRHELARHYLASSAMPIAEVGYLLGFRDTPAFHHADSASDLCIAALEMHKSEALPGASNWSNNNPVGLVT